jgi:hypothetical protein
VNFRSLSRLKALYIGCGEKDQFNLLYGARRFVLLLDRYFERTHGGFGLEFRSLREIERGAMADPTGEADKAL